MGYLGIELLMFSDTADYSFQATMAGWDLLAMLLLGGTFLFANRQSRDPEARAWFDDELVRTLPAWFGRLIDLGMAIIPVVVSMIGLSAALTVLYDDAADADITFIIQLQGVFTIALAWLMLHVSYSQRYAWVFYRHGGGLKFPQTRYPVAVDFLYFALTMGSSFATSDVEVINRRMRWHVTGHSVLSFFYNAVVLAVAVSLITAK